MQSDVKITLGIIALTLVIIGGGAVVFGRQEARPSVSGINRDALLAPESLEDTLVVGTDRPVRGGDHASVTIVEFGDFQCPACGSMHPVLEQIRAEFGDRVRIVFRHFPLRQIHAHAFDAALAAESAGAQRKFWEMHDRLFETQGEWSSAGADAFGQYARDLGLDADRVARDIKEKTYEERVTADLRDGRAAGVRGTPTLFVNGKQYFGALSAEDLRRAIREELSEGGA